MKLKHAPILALPTEYREKLDLALVKNTSTKVVAESIKNDGFFSETSVPTLARALRAYKRDTITVNEIARREAYENHANPKTRARVREVVDALQLHSDWVRLLDSRKAAYERAAEQLKSSPGMAGLSDTLRKAAESLHVMYRDHTKFLMDTGLIRRAPVDIHIRAEHVVIGSDKDASQLLEALYEYLGRTPDPTGLLAGGIDYVQRSLKDREPLEPEMQALIDSVRADLRAIPRKALPPPTVEAEPRSRIPTEFDVDPNEPCVIIDTTRRIDDEPIHEINPQELRW
jgi:hypothetical protein